MPTRCDRCDTLYPLRSISTTPTERKSLTHAFSYRGRQIPYAASVFPGDWTATPTALDNRSASVGIFKGGEGMSERFGVNDHSGPHAPETAHNPTKPDSPVNIGANEPASGSTLPSYAAEPTVSAVCTQCGASTADNRLACPKCGQPYYAEPQLGTNILGPLCYLGGWLTGLMVYLGIRQAPVTDQRARFLRFHSAQSVVTFGGLTIAFMVFGSFPILLTALLVLSFGVWGLLLFKSFQGGCYKLPYVGDIAARM
jgi:uncharacterized membrane protein